MALTIARLDTHQHNRAGFVCGVEALDSYLRQQAKQHQRDGIATIHVLQDDADPSRILGYCALSAAQLYLQELSDTDRKRLPAWPVPAMRMGRLAIAATEQGKGYGKILLGHAVRLACTVRQTMGVRVLIVDAKNAAAVAFYQSYGFRPTASKALTLYLPV